MIKLSVSEKGFAIFRDGVVLLSRGYSYSNKRDAILRNLQRGVLHVLIMLLTKIYWL